MTNFLSFCRRMGHHDEWDEVGFPDFPRQLKQYMATPERLFRIHTTNIHSYVMCVCVTCVFCWFPHLETQEHVYICYTNIIWFLSSACSRSVISRESLGCGPPGAPQQHLWKIAFLWSAADFQGRTVKKSIRNLHFTSTFFFWVWKWTPICESLKIFCQEKNRKVHIYK